MSWQATGTAWSAPTDVQGSQLLVLLALSWNAKNDGTEAFPSVATLAARARVSERTVQRQLRSLEKRGLVVATAHEKGGRNNPTHYAITAKKGDSGLGERVTPVTRKGDKTVAPETYPTVQVRKTNPTGATAPTVVAEYVKARAAHGLATDRTMRAIIGKYAKELTATSGWDSASVLDAVRQFAATKRHPRWLSEWVATVFNAESSAAHEQRQREEWQSGPIAPTVLSAIRRGAA